MVSGAGREPLRDVTKELDKSIAYENVRIACELLRRHDNIHVKNGMAPEVDIFYISYEHISNGPLRQTVHIKEMERRATMP